MSREMTHSGGHHAGRNYDELMEMAGEPQHHGHQGHQGHPGHNGHPSHHGHPGGGHMVPAAHAYAPQGYAPPVPGPHQGHHGHHPAAPVYVEPQRPAHHDHAPLSDASLDRRAGADA